MGESYHSVSKQLHQVLQTDEFKVYIKQKVEKAFSDITLCCPGCNQKVTTKHSVQACVISKYQTIGHQINKLKKDVSVQTKLQLQAEQLKARNRSTLH